MGHKVYEISSRFLNYAFLVGQKIAGGQENGAVNPSLTIMANALKVGDRILARC